MYSKIFLGCCCLSCTAIRPNITIPPKNVSGDFQEEVVLTCTADAQPPPQYTWFILRGDERMVLENETESTLVIENLAVEDRGVYSCNASNVLDNDTSAEVVVNIAGR